MKFKELLESKLTEQSNDYYTLRKTKIDNKNIWVLTLTEKGFNKVKKYFDINFKIYPGNTDKITKDLLFDNKKWKLNLTEIKTDNDIKYRVFGSSMDYTFGKAPAFYNYKFNLLKPSKELFGNFIKYLK